MKESGDIAYMDEYGTQYYTQWDTVNGNIDITTTTMQPYVWGRDPEGYIEDKVLYMLGIITIERRVIGEDEDGDYYVIAEGSTQYIDYIRMSYPCENRFEDKFSYHLNSAISEELSMIVSSGTH